MNQQAESSANVIEAAWLSLQFELQKRVDINHSLWNEMKRRLRVIVNS